MSFRRAFVICCTLAVVIAPATLAFAMPQRGAVVVCAVDDAISPVTAEFIIDSLAAAQEQDAALFLLRIDTPGGLEVAMRDIMQAFLASEVPTAVYVAPSGAQAASAGFMIALSADIVAMASGTNTGAATPVSVGGGEIDDELHAKIIQNAVASARSVAEQRGRPVGPAVEAVETGRSFAASEALALGLADAIVEDIDELIAEFDGHVVREGTDAARALDLAGAEVVELEMNFRQRVLSTLANPQIAYFLLLLGIGGLYFELSNPGAVAPGVIGATSLVLALLAFQQLPFSYAGLALLALGVIFLILEVNVVSYGMLTLAGLICFVLGSLLLFRGPVPEMRLSLGFVLPTAIVFVGLMAFMVQMVVRTHRGRVLTGRAGMITEIGEATSDFEAGGEGQVFVRGEIWKARADEAIARGDAVEVVDIDAGLQVKVRRLANEQRS